MQIGETQYILLIYLSNVNYCPLVWHFCWEVDTKKIHETALRFIYQDYNSSYDTLLGKSQQP